MKILIATMGCMQFQLWRGLILHHLPWNSSGALLFYYISCVMRLWLLKHLGLSACSLYIAMPCLHSFIHLSFMLSANVHCVPVGRQPLGASSSKVNPCPHTVDILRGDIKCSNESGYSSIRYNSKW